jgi:hypothetical protein
MQREGRKTKNGKRRIASWLLNLLSQDLTNEFTDNQSLNWNIVALSS